MGWRAYPAYIVEWDKKKGRWILLSNGGRRKEKMIGRPSIFKRQVLSRAKWNAKRQIPSRVLVLNRKGLVMYELEYNCKYPQGIKL